MIIHSLMVVVVYWSLLVGTKGQIPLRYPTSEPARELVCDLLASWTA